MKTRIISACIMLPLLLLVYFGGYPLMAACLVIGLMGSYEFIKGFKALDVHAYYPMVVVATVGLYAFNICFNLCKDTVTVQDNMTMYLFWFFICTLFSMLILFRKGHEKLEDAMVTMLALFYVVFFSYHVLLVDQTESYSILVWLIFLTAFGTDIFAYFTGYAIGKHKLCPTISPKKTIEGSIGGAIGSIVLCIVFSLIFVPELMLHCAVIGLLGGVISQFGDLTASIFKRKMGIKDYGNLIPGHGGIMDRFDSVLFTAPLIYYYITIFMM